jgi:4-hydroxy-3-methylbut-2-enyl diphosphate reductase
VARFIAKHIDRLNELRIIKTTCPETDQRYDAARTLATESDLLIVVGGKNSANTRKLAEICAASGVETHHIETAAEIDHAWLADKKAVGVTAGTSTPDESVEAVLGRLRELPNMRRDGR